MRTLNTLMVTRGRGPVKKSEVLCKMGRSVDLTLRMRNPPHAEREVYTNCASAALGAARKQLPHLSLLARLGWHAMSPAKGVNCGLATPVEYSERATL